jgi:threonine dehydratase
MNGLHDAHQEADAAAFAAAMQERAQLTGQTVGVALSGGNVDTAMFASALQNQ